MAAARGWREQTLFPAAIIHVREKEKTNLENAEPRQSGVGFFT